MTNLKNSKNLIFSSLFLSLFSTNSATAFGTGKILQANFRNQMLGTTKLFKKYENTTLDEIVRGNNITLINENVSVDSKGSLDGYDNDAFGLVGLFPILSNTYLSAGFVRNAYTYDNGSNSDVNTFHLGFNSLYTIFDILDLRVSGFYEYNLHEVSRDVYGKGQTAESDFNSYALGLYWEASKTFNTFVTIRPLLSFDLGYYEHESFYETINGHKINNLNFGSKHHTTFNPRIGLDITKQFQNLTLYTKGGYSHEFWDYSIDDLNYDEVFHVDLDDKNIEKGILDFQVGFKYGNERIKFDLGLGREYGERDATIVTGKFGYSL